MKKLIALLVVVFSSLFFAGDVSANDCVPGQQNQCLCPAKRHRLGFQVCEDDGKRFSECECAEYIKPHRDYRVRADPSLFGGGIAFTVLGGATLLFGVPIEFAVHSKSSLSRESDNIFYGALITTTVISSVMLTTGIIMTAIGGHKVVVNKTGLNLPPYIPSIGFTDKSANVGWTVSF